MRGGCNDDVIDQISAEIGNKLKFYRTSYGLNRHVCGEIMHVSGQQVQKYEQGIDKISAARLYLLSKKLKFDINNFFEEPSKDMNGKLFYRGVIKRLFLLKKKEQVAIVQTFIDQLISLEASHEYTLEKGD